VGASCSPKKKANHHGYQHTDKNRTDETVAAQKLVDGLNKNAAAIPSIVIDGAVLTTKDIVGTLQSRIDEASTVLSTRATWQAAVQADRVGRDKAKPFVSGLRQALLVAFASKIDTLADFGLTPRKVHVASPEANLARTQKALATRAARHTMGSRQKKAIKGTIAPTALAPDSPKSPAT